MRHIKSCLGFSLILSVVWGGCGTEERMRGISEPAVAPEVPSEKTYQTRLIHAQPVRSGEFDETGLLLSIRDVDQGPSICTAVWIAPDVALTAAHCVTDLAHDGTYYLQSNYFYYYLSNAIDFESVKKNNTSVVEDVVVHPDYRFCDAQQFNKGIQSKEIQDLCGEPWRHSDYRACLMGLPREMLHKLTLDGSAVRSDIAMVFLKKPWPYAKPAKVVGPHTPSYVRMPKNVILVGYGSQDASDTPDVGVKMAGSSSVETWMEQEFLTSPLESSAQACHGDSGGPAFADLGAGSSLRYLVGITSRLLSDTQGTCQGGALYGRVDVLYRWIDAEMIKACRQGIRRTSFCSKGGGLDSDASKKSVCSSMGVPEWSLLFVILTAMRNWRRQDGF